MSEMRSRLFVLCYTHNAQGYYFDAVFSPDLSEVEAVIGFKRLYTTALRFVVVTTNADKKEAGNWRSIMDHNKATIRWKMAGYFNQALIDRIFEINTRRRTRRAS